LQRASSRFRADSTWYVPHPSGSKTHMNTTAPSLLERLRQPNAQEA
jgi:hypothetical protein